MLANQVAGKPIDLAILQMQFSEKRASTRIMNMLATARDHASRYKNLEQDKLIVCAYLFLYWLTNHLNCAYSRGLGDQREASAQTDRASRAWPFWYTIPPQLKVKCGLEGGKDG